MIFISHSSKDKEAALTLRQKLLDHGYGTKQLFLDSDAESGIPAGSKWEQELYAHLKDCQALLVVCSANLQNSKWCFAELVFAKAMGKAIFPILIEDCIIDQVVGEHQSVFVHKDGEDAYARLFDALDNNHLGPTDDFGWPPKDGDGCPYPGLLAFDETLAGVYFGREDETQSLLQELRKMRANGEPRLLMIVGGSGSGKSSLLKAGILPRLRHKTADSDWLVVPTFRFGERGNEQQTIFDQLAANVASLFPKESPVSWRWTTLRGKLVKSDPKNEAVEQELIEEVVSMFLQALLDLVIARQCPEATVLIPIDQFEELLAPSAGPVAGKFIRFLKLLFGSRNGRLLGIGTMRSDHLDAYERNTNALASPFFVSWRLGPFPPERIGDVIQKPAKRAKVQISEELVEKLKSDTPTTEALPLLAFTLEKLYKRCASDGKLELQEYKDLGGMEGSIQKCVEHLIPANSLSPEQTNALRLSFVKHLVQVNDKGEEVRLTARWDSLPEAVKPILEQFINERLLTRTQHHDEQDPTNKWITVEVAHEAIFRCWDDLKRWIRVSVDILRWRRDVRRDQANDKHWTGLRPAQLAVARNWPQTRREELASDELAWIEEGIFRQNVRLVLTAAVVLLIVISAVFAWSQKSEADQATTTAKDLVVQLRSEKGGAELAKRQAQRELGSVKMVLGDGAANKEGKGIQSAFDYLAGAAAFRDAGEKGLSRICIYRGIRAAEGLVASLPISHMGNSLAKGAIWGDHCGVVAMRDGRRILTYGWSGEACLWEVTERATLLRRFEHQDSLSSAEFSPDEKRVLICGQQAVYVWELDGKADRPDCVLSTSKPNATEATDSVFPNARYLAAGKQVLVWDGQQASLWELSSGAAKLLRTMPHEDLQDVEVSPNEQVVLTRGGASVQLWNISGDASTPPFVLEQVEMSGHSAKWDIGLLATWTTDGQIKLWARKNDGWDNTSTVQEQRQTSQEGPLFVEAVLNKKGTRLVSWSKTGATFWAIEGNLLKQRHAIPQKELREGEFVLNEDAFAAWSSYDLRIFDLDGGLKADLAKIDAYKSIREIHGLSSDSEGKRLLIASFQGTFLLDLEGKEWKVEPVGDGEEGQFSNDGSRILIWNSSEASIFTKDEQGYLKQEQQFDHPGVGVLTLLPDGKRAITLSGTTWQREGMARIWDTTKAHSMRFEHAEGGEFGSNIRGVQFSNGGKRILSWSADGTVRCWRVNKGAVVLEKTFKHGSSVSGAILDSKEDVLLSWSDTEVRSWRLDGADSTSSLLFAKPGILAATFDAQEERAIVLTRGNLSLVPLTSNGILNSVIYAEGPKAKSSDSRDRPAVLSPDAKKIVTWGKEEARVWRVKPDGFETIGAIPFHPVEKTDEYAIVEQGVAFSESGKMILVWRAAEASLWKLEATSMSLIKKMPEPVSTAAFARDESRFVTTADKEAVLWSVDPTVNEPLERFRHAGGAWGGISGARFNRDGKKLLTWGSEGSARLWSADRSEAPLQHFYHERGANGDGLIKEVTAAVFSTDESLVLTSGEDGTVRLWPVGGGTEKPISIIRVEGVYDFLKGDFDRSCNLIAAYGGNAGNVIDLAVDETVAIERRRLELEVRTAAVPYSRDSLRMLSVGELLEQQRKLEGMQQTK
jgi:WD40 repeat protein